MKLSAILEFIIRRITDMQFSPFTNGSSFSKGVIVVGNGINA